jgi:hypothetical protein
MRARFNLLLVLFSICLFNCVARAQTKPATQTEINRQAALAQLSDSLPADERGCLNLRARMELADLLWSRDEARARQLFEEAFNAAFGGETAKDGQCPAQARQAFGAEALSRIARHDAAWAAQFVDSLPEAAQQKANELDIKARLRQSLNTSSTTADGENARLIQASIFGEVAAKASDQNSADLAPLELLNTPAARSAFANPNLEAAQAILNGDFNQASQLGEKIGEAQTRAQFGALVRFGEMNAAISAGDEQEALRCAEMLPDVAGRASAFVTLANAARGKKGALRAMEILLAARQSVEAEKESAEKAQAFITLAEAMIDLDVERGFDLAQTAIAALNAVGDDSSNSADTALGQVLSRLSQSDFNRAWGLALGINNRETAWFTKLALCRGAFGKA